jgi:hypothetical protein
MRSLYCMIALVLVAFYSAAASAAILIKIDKSTQRMTVLRDGQELYNWPVSTGAPGYSTPSGSFKAFRMEAEHFSKEWDDAPMPHSIFFTQNGIAVHGTYEAKHLGSPVSHGCVRLSTAHAATLYDLVKQDGLLTTQVVLTGNEQIAVANQAAQRGLARAVDTAREVQPAVETTGVAPSAVDDHDVTYATPTYRSQVRDDRYDRYDRYESRDDPRYGQPPFLQPGYRQSAAPVDDYTGYDDDN